MEDNSDASKGSGSNSEVDRAGSSKDPKDPKDGQPDKNNRPKRNNIQTLEMSDTDDDMAPETNGYISPANSRLSYVDYTDEYDDDDGYEDDEELMEIQIETLTGTTFRVRVSSKESAAGLKYLLYRTEGG